MSTDKDWEKWGSDNPYYGVLSDSKFLGSALDEKMEQEFFEAGRGDIDQLMSRVHALGRGQI